MRYMIIGGDHPRHLYYANAIAESCNVVGTIIEHRESLMPEPPEGLEERDRNNFIRHFKNREKYEKEYFGEERKLPNCPIHYVNRDTLSSEETVAFVKQCAPDVVFIYGPGMIREPLFSALPKHKINLHLGLSPRYRGSATLFWPFYFLEPNWSGSTFHIISDEPDAGEIIHQSVPELRRGDTIHEVSCRVVQQSSEDVKKIISALERGAEPKLHRQTSSGKNFLMSDFMPQHLRVIYDLYDDALVDAFLDGKVTPKDPKPITLSDSC